MSQFNFNEHCEELLAEYKRRDGQRVAQRLQEIRGTLRRAGYETVQTMFGGSVKRGTYVSGLSDEDTLLIVNQSGLDTQSPSKSIKDLEKVIQGHFQNNRVIAGKLAVTVSFAKGPEMQILPAVRTNSGGIRIADPGSSKWSNITRPENFAEQADQSQQCQRQQSYTRDQVSQGNSSMLHQASESKKDHLVTTWSL